MTASPKQRSCTECGRTFTGYKRRCRACRMIDRACAECGKLFRGDEIACSACRASERACTECGETFRGRVSRCASCQAKERTCTECSAPFRGRYRRCDRCRRSEQTCTDCGRVFKGRSAGRCPACQERERACVDCGAVFRGRGRRCRACQIREKTCPSCGETFTKSTLECAACIRRALPPNVRRSAEASLNNARRARKREAEVAGPVSRATYAALQASGPCVYCGCAAETVDHVRPLARSGWEHEDNLVPACKSCNFSKGSKLLTEWSRAASVAYGVAHSPKVAAEYERLTAVAA